MSDPALLRRRAIRHMRCALSLLDQAGEHTATGHLQMAHDVVARIPSMVPGKTLPDEGDPPELVADLALVRSVGGALVVFATLISRVGDTPVEEIAEILGIYAVASSETFTEEGLILSSWASMLREVAQMHDDRITN